MRTQRKIAVGVFALLLGAASPLTAPTAQQTPPDASPQQLSAQQRDDFARFGILSLVEGRQFQVEGTYSDGSRGTHTAKFYWLDEGRTVLRELKIVQAMLNGSKTKFDVRTDWTVETGGILKASSPRTDGSFFVENYRLRPDGGVETIRPNQFSGQNYKFVFLNNSVQRQSFKKNGKLVGTQVFVESGDAYDADFAALPGFNERMARERRAELAEERRRGQTLMRLYLDALSAAARAGESTATAPPAGAVGDMGGKAYRPAPRMTPEQQSKADELERYKMREQARLGQTPTTFAEDARAKTDAQNRRIADEQARRAREATASTAQREADDKAAAERQQLAEAAEARRKVETAAAAEQARKDRLAADEATRRKREAEARERAENAPVAWKEGVVLCEPAKAPSRNATCHGPLQTTWGTLGEQSGRTALQQACGGNDPVRELGQAGGFLAFGCGWGTHPAKPASDIPARHGVGYVPGRRTFYCSPKQTTVCRTD